MDVRLRSLGFLEAVDWHNLDCDWVGMASSSGGFSDDEDMDVDWHKVGHSRKVGVRKDKLKSTPTGKRALVEEGARHDQRKKVLMEEFKVLLKFKPRNEITGESNCSNKWIEESDQ